MNLGNDGKPKIKGLREKNQMDEIDQPTLDMLLQGAGVLGVGALTGLIMKLQDILKKKNPQAYEKLQNVRGAVGAADPSKNI
jgi:methylthioribose-1-phosphate isomerase